MNYKMIVVIPLMIVGTLGAHNLEDKLQVVRTLIMSLQSNLNDCVANPMSRGSFL